MTRIGCFSLSLVLALGGLGCASSTEVELTVQTAPEVPELQVAVEGIVMPLGVAVSVLVTASAGNDGEERLEVELSSRDPEVLAAIPTARPGQFYLVATGVGTTSVVVRAGGDEAEEIEVEVLTQ